MSQAVAPEEVPGPRAARAAITGLSLAAGGVLAAVAAWWVYRVAMAEEGWRTRCLVTWIVAGGIGTLCLGGAIGCLGRLLEGARSRVARGGVVVLQRVALAGQLLLTGLVLLAAGLWMFGVRIPGPDRAVLTPGWQPPQPATAPMP